MIHDNLGALGGVIERLEGRWVSPVKSDGRFYDWVPLPVAEFLAGLRVCSERLVDRHRHWPPEGFRFLDVGSGIGTKMVLASALGYAVTGVELRPEYAEASRELCPEAEVVCADAFEWSGYGTADVVYSYRPCLDLEDQAGLTKRIVAEMKPGALLFLAGGPDPEGLEVVSGAFGVWVT